MALEIFRLMGSVFVDTDKAEKSLHKTDDKAANLGKTLLAGVGHAAAWGAAAITAAVGVGAKFVSMAGNAEAAFAKVQTLLDTDTDMQAYYQDIMTASTQTGVAFGDFSEAVYGAISASVDAADAVDFTTQAVKLAKGGFTETSTAVDVLTTAINAYGMSADDASHISDVLIGTQNAGKTTVDELSASLGKTIPVANANNVAFEELSAMYAILTKNGIATAEAGTGIKAMLSELGKTGSKSDLVLRELTATTMGQAMGFAELQAEGFTTDEVLVMLQDSAAASGKKLSDMFGSVEAGNAALTLMKDSGKELHDLNWELANSAGAAEAAYATMGQTFEEKLEIIKNSFTNVAIALGNELMPIAMQLLDWVQTHMPEIQATIQVVFEFVRQAVSIVGQVIAWLFGQIQQYLPQMQAIATTVFNAIATVAGWLADRFNQYFPAIQKFVQDAFARISQYWHSDLQPLFQAIGAFIQNVLAPAFNQVFNHLIVPYVQSAFKFISDIWNGTLKPVFTGIISFLTGVFTANWSQAFNGLKSIVSGAFNGMVSLIKAPLNTCIGIINSFLGKLSSISIPSWVPGIGGKSFSVSKIPMLAEGGILERGQLGFLEGNGAEAVVPLENNKKWISAVAQDMNQAIGGNRETMELLANISAKLDKISKMGVVLDTGAMVGGLAGPMDRRLGTIQAQKARA